MGRHFAEIAFTSAVQAEQTRIGSRRAYERMAREGQDDGRIGPDEAGFITARDSFYMASVSETGWPYVQHRGGPPGFLRVLSPTRIGFADLDGNRQHVSIGNVAADGRIALFLMDYPARLRLKILGHARVVREGEDAALVAGLAPPGLEDRAERAILVDIAGFEWNCPQHITPRYTAAELAPLVARLEAAEAELARLRTAQDAAREP